MIFNNYFILLNYIITNYDNLNKSLILNEKKENSELFMASDEYIYWHIKNVGTNISNKKILSGEIPLKNIKKKPKNYYLNIFINNNSDFLELAFFDIFFDDIKIAILVTDYLKNYDTILINTKKLLEKYNIHYYFCIYDVIDSSYKEKINTDKLKELFNYNGISIKKYTEIKNISENKELNNLFYTTSNIYECYNLLNENYFIYISLQSNFTINIDEIINKYFDEIINSKIVLHGNIISYRDEDNELYNDYKLSYKCAICNLFSAEIFFKFHMEIYNYHDTPERALYFYLIKKETEFIMDNLYVDQKYKKKYNITINKNLLIKKY